MNCVFFVLFLFCRRNVESFHSAIIRHFFSLFSFRCCCSFPFFFGSLCIMRTADVFECFSRINHTSINRIMTPLFMGHFIHTEHWIDMWYALIYLEYEDKRCLAKLISTAIAIGIEMNGSMATILMRWQTCRFIFFVSKWFFWSLDVLRRFDSIRWQI